jgi:hypothetical protein
MIWTRQMVGNRRELWEQEKWWRTGENYENRRNGGGQERIMRTGEMVEDRRELWEQEKWWEQERIMRTGEMVGNRRGENYENRKSGGGISSACYLTHSCGLDLWVAGHVQTPFLVGLQTGPLELHSAPRSPSRFCQELQGIMLMWSTTERYCWRLDEGEAVLARGGNHISVISNKINQDTQKLCRVSNSGHL